MISDYVNFSVLDGPHLVMVIQPETKYRFRYESEGGSHGGLTGREKIKGKKTYPTIKLINYNGSSHNIIIRVRLYTERRTEHVLEFKKKKSVRNENYIDVELNDDYTAIFKDITILSKKKEDIYQALMDLKVRSLGKNLSRSGRDKFERENSEDIKKEARDILNSVVLRFDAFEEGMPDVLICPPLFSDPICNQKASSKGDLKIHRMSKVAGSWRGEEEVILLCDKVQKDNIKILFYETDVSERRWEAYATFSPADVHYQVAITFKTPKYKENIEKTVGVCLERSGELSEPRCFTFIPEDCPSKKRKKCVPEQTLDILSSAMNMSSDSSTTAMSDDNNSQEAMHFQELCNSEIDESNFDLSSNLETPSSVLDPSMFNDLQDFLSNFEVIENENWIFAEDHLDGLQSYGTNEIEMDVGKVERRFEPQMSLESFDISEFLPPKRIYQEESEDQNPIGKIVAQMSSVKLKGAGLDFNIPPKNFHEKTKSIKISKNKKDNLKKYSHLVLKRDKWDNSLLHLAVLHNKNIGIVMCMNKMAESDIINSQNCSRQTALHIAVEKNADAVQVLLLNGSNPNIKNGKGNNCYHMAAQNNLDTVMIDLLTYSKFPPELHECNYEGLTPLHVAIKNSTSCYLLLKNNHMANLNVLERTCGRSLLHYAVEFQPSLIIPILEEGQIDVNIKDFEGNTPLHIACAMTKYGTVKQLLLANADPSIRNFKQNLLDAEEESSEDENQIGQIPADLTANPEILELLKQASERNRLNLNASTSNSGSAEISEELLRNLSNALNPSMRWKAIAAFIIDEKYIIYLENSENPTRDILKYMKKNIGEGYIDQFKEVLEATGLNDVTKILTESNKSLIVL